MSKEREYEELYDRLLREGSTLHRNNRRIRIGMKMLVAVTVGLMLLMFLSQGNKIFALMLWILSMFAVAAYLIAVEYADYELQKKLEYITLMQQQSMGALLMLPELPGSVITICPFHLGSSRSSQVRGASSSETRSVL